MSFEDGSEDDIEYVIDKQKGKMFFWDKNILGVIPLTKENGITLFSDKSIVCEHTKTKDGYVGACVKCIEKVRDKKVFKQFL